MKNACLLLLVGLLSWFSGQAQTTPPDSTASDSLLAEPDNLPADDPRTFSLVFNRGFAYLPNAFQMAQDTVPFSGSSSGTYFLGAGIIIPFGPNTFGMRVAPGFAWTVYDYAQTGEKTFPSVLDESQPLVFENHRTQWVEVPTGFYWNITRDEDADPYLFLELGGYVGYMISAQYRTQYESGARTITNIQRGLAQEGDFRRVRYGAYARLGYKWFALYGAFRISEVWDEFGSAPGQGSAYRNPKAPPLELGLSLLW